MVKPAPVEPPAKGVPLAVTVASGEHQTFRGMGTSIGNWGHGYERLAPKQRQLLAKQLWADLGFPILRLWINTYDCSPKAGVLDLADFRSRYIDSGVVADARANGVTTVLLAPEGLPDYLAEPDGDARKLIADGAEPYADLVASFIIALRDQAGLTIDATGMQNEPNDKDHFSAAQVVAIVKRLRSKLDAAGMNQVLIVAPETSSADQVLYEWLDALHADAEAWKAIAGISSHSYNMAATSEADRRRFGKDYWMTEASDNGPEEAGDALRASSVATRVLNDLNHGVTHWIHFLGFETDDPKDNATRIFSLRSDGTGWTTFRKHAHYRMLSRAFPPGAVLHRCVSSLDGEMTWTYGKKPRITAACARLKDGWSVGLSNYTAPTFSDRGDTGTWSIDQEGYAAVTYAVTVTIAELSSAGDLPVAVTRCNASGPRPETTATMHSGAVTLDITPLETVTLRIVR
ncbi:MAG: hypothetical protein H0W72_15700 [Planctomycetes bacterium]|nr:hypothetical protein [Planctomycetota bacterium]